MKKIRLGLFGAEDSIEIMESVVMQYPEFSCISISYWRDEEIIEKLTMHMNDVDMWLFSGQIPYGFAKKWGGITQPMFYVPSSGSSLFKTLLQIAYNQKIPFDQISFDMFHPAELERVFKESKIAVKPTYIKYYEGEVPTDEIVHYHYELWKTGKTAAAVTCLKNAQHELNKLGVPAFRVLPTQSAIVSTLALILQTHETMHFKDTQIAVQMIEFDSFSSLTKDTFSTDEIYKIEIKMTEKLLEYAKKINGSLKSAGPGRFVIFTTHGLLRETTKDFTVVPDFAILQLTGHDAVTCGIGIGQTVYEAEINAGTALLHAKEFHKGSSMVVLDDKTIVGPLGQPEQIKYGYATKHLQTLSEQTSLSIATLSKLESILKKIGKLEINAYDLAQHMHIMPRSARRILTELESKGLAQVVGEENPHPRGRPRKIYQIML
ncbi:ArsR family transcriptional regulator [Psychrobacillus sp. OK032]|uniref:ArsR family transcriptional regulator n=1 Tax=Psychrobacillus sp. OK032 TaxID=1884358 RepID=UPI0021010374|nr:ArsR family transcriptional regulator [Psychrobacillus sp. OK032]